MGLILCIPQESHSDNRHHDLSVPLSCFNREFKEANITLSKPVRILVGIATFWYALYLLLTILGIVLFFGYVFVSLMAGGESVANLPRLFREILSLEFMLPIHLCNLSLEVVLLIFYLVHTIKNTKAGDALRIALGLGHLFLPFVAMPIYYYLYIWLETPTDWATAKARKGNQLARSSL